MNHKCIQIIKQNQNNNKFAKINHRIIMEMTKTNQLFKKKTMKIINKIIIHSTKKKMKIA